MKENGMKKLIELLNEYEEEKAKYGNQYCNWQYIGGRPICTTSYDMNRIVQFSDLLIISKMYEFIDWLVDKDKIDRHNVGYSTMLGQLSDYHGLNGEQELLMILAIQENPISFLISILK